MLIGIVLIIGILLVFDIPFDYYYQGGEAINLLLAPATACLGVSIYKQFDILKEHWLPILVGCFCGALTGIGSVWGMCKLLKLDDLLTTSLLAKSVTTPIAVSVTQTLGGLPPITVMAVIISGIFGGIAAPAMIKMFRIKDPMVAGVSIGTCAHGGGTSKAVQLGETEGAMSGLAIGVAGICTVVISLFI
jgi:putative effector of murein hydrolase